MTAGRTKYLQTQDAHVDTESESSSDDTEPPMTVKQPISKVQRAKAVVTKPMPTTPAKLVSSEVSAKILETPAMKKIGNLVDDHHRRPQNEYRMLVDKLEPPGVENPLADRVAEDKKVYRYDVEKREMFETTMTKKMEGTRDFYPATDEEIAAAAVRARRLLRTVWAEEAPKKERIWERVWAKYGDKSRLNLSVSRAF